ncbi:hypothetical protein BS47DRAFT_205292 [Hydnum rufescens UP504]|uniref:Uncharacterized protein n=1 Tax=Hydnum rufescens UP504 TaxID=1448309 RepID=A0A9P6AMX1_9AGAM|nr:hypothetical protein BS47DRAFT_205292 [Hydnum rufescens UP504]
MRIACSCAIFGIVDAVECHYGHLHPRVRPALRLNLASVFHPQAFVRCYVPLAWGLSLRDSNDVQSKPSSPLDNDCGRAAADVL